MPGLAEDFDSGNSPFASFAGFVAKDSLFTCNGILTGPESRAVHRFRDSNQNHCEKCGLAADGPETQGA